MLEQEQYVYLIRTVGEECTMTHTEAFVDERLATEHFENNLKFYRKKDWSVNDERNYCVGSTVRRAEMVKKDRDGKYEHRTLILEAYEIIKK